MLNKSVDHDVFNNKDFKKFKNKRNSRPSKYYAWSPNPKGIECYESDDLSEFLLHVAFEMRFYDTYLGLDKSASNLPVIPTDTDLLTLHCSVSFSMDQELWEGDRERSDSENGRDYCDYSDRIDELFYCLLSLKEMPIAVIAKGYYSFTFLYQRTATPAIPTNEVYKSYVFGVLNKIIPWIGFNSDSRNVTDWREIKPRPKPKQKNIISLIN